MASIIGTSLNDTLVGSNLDDEVFGLSGNDQLSGGEGTDILHGGEGDDTLFGSAVTSSSIWDGTFGTPFLARANWGGDNGWNSQSVVPRLLADVNGDGRADIVAFGASNVNVALGQADGTFGPGQIARNGFGYNNGWSSQGTALRRLGDVNGDGRADIVGFGPNNVNVALGQADGTFGPSLVGLANKFGPNNGWTQNGTYPRWVADVNGDGRADIVGFGPTNTNVALGQANGTFGAPLVAYSGSFTVNTGWSSYDIVPRTVADVNGDGRADIVGFGGNHVSVALGQTDGTFGPSQIALSSKFGVNNSWASQDIVPRTVADVNGDGRADIIGFDGWSEVLVALGRADGTFDQPSKALVGYYGPTSGWSSHDEFPRWVADVNGDGLADIVGFGQSGTYVSLANTTSVAGKADTLAGGVGNDLYYVIDPAETIVEAVGEGTDEVRTALAAHTLAANVEILTYTGTASFAGTGNSGANHLNGGDGSDILNGLDGDDTLNGAAGNDTLDGGSGDDMLIGGMGDDVYVVDSAQDIIQEQSGQGLDEVRTILAVQTLGANLETLTFIGTGDFTGTGNGLDNRIVGGSGADTLSGGDGADTLVGGDGDDRFYIDAADAPVDGGAGFDTAVVQGSTGVDLDLAASSLERVYGGGGDDSLTGAGATGAVWINGRDGDDLILGGAFADTLTGGAAGDTLLGGEGDDLLYIDAADRLVDGGAGFDTASVQGDGDVALDLAATSIERVVSGAGNDQLTASTATAAVEINGGDGNDLVGGGALDDTLRGDAGDDSLHGGDGNDVLVGGAGSDTMIGGGGDDRLYIDASTALLDGGEGDDTVYARYAGGVSLDLSSSIELFSGSVGDDSVTAANAATEIDMIGGTGNDWLMGTAYADSVRGDDGNDTLFGGAGADTLSGGNGNDRLAGDAGDDSLWGGNGADLFLISAGSGNDTIRDFNAAQGDLIGLAAGQAYTVDVNGEGNAVIVFSATDRVTLTNIQPAAVSGSWFVTI